MPEYILPVSTSVGFCKKNFEEMLQETAALGYQYIDFDVSGKWERPFSEKIRYRYLEKGLQKVKEKGLLINAVHISFGPNWDPSETIEKRRVKIVKKIVEVIKRTDPYDPFCYVLHGSFEPILSVNRERKKEALLRSIKDICAATKNYICLEILPRTCLLNTAKEGNEILDRANLNNLRICLDTNHFLQEKTEEGVLALGDRIATLHVSDYDGNDEKHWLPGKGIIDWNAVLGALEKIGYHGAFNYEVKESPKIVQENHKMLFDAYNRQKQQ